MPVPGAGTVGRSVGGFEGFQAEALDGCEALIGRSGPAEGLGIGIDGGDAVENGLLGFPGGAVEAAPQLLFGKPGEEALHLNER
jgi:hypothetical protein